MAVHRAASMSYPLDSIGGAMDLAAKKGKGNALMKNHSDLVRLRKMNISDILKTIEGIMANVLSGPCVDNVYINSGVWRDEIALSKSNEIGLITGYNHNDEFPGLGDSSFALLMGNFSDGIDLGDLLRTVYLIVAKYRYLAYVVQFSHSKPGPTQLGAIHDGDKPFFFNYFSHVIDKYWGQSDLRMGKTASQHFINFCKTGDPNGEGLPNWE